MIVTVMQDDNIHQHAFIIEMSSIIFKTVEDALIYFENYKEILS